MGMVGDGEGKRGSTTPATLATSDLNGRAVAYTLDGGTYFL